jgi:hypothetical protein
MGCVAGTQVVYHRNRPHVAYHRARPFRSHDNHWDVYNTIDNQHTKRRHARLEPTLMLVRTTPEIGEHIDAHGQETHTPRWVSCSAPKIRVYGELKLGDPAPLPRSVSI